MNFQIERLRRLPQRDDVWQGGIVPMPGWITGEDRPPYRGLVPIWVSVRTGRVHCPTVLRPEDARPERLLESLAGFASDRKIGGYRPAQIEVKDADLARHLADRLAGTGIDVVCRDELPAVDEVMASFEAQMAGPDVSPLPSMLAAPGVTVARVRAFADAAKAFYAAQPWLELSDADLIHVKTPGAPPELSRVVVMGQSGITTGLGFFRSEEEFWSLQAGTLTDRAGRWSVMFDQPEATPPVDLNLWREHDLPLPPDRAHPTIAWFDAGEHEVTRPDAKSLAFAEGLLRVLARVRPEQLDRGQWTATVPTADGRVKFSVTLPLLLKPPSAEQLARLGLLDHRTNERVLVQVARFASSRPDLGLDEMNRLLGAEFGNRRIEEYAAEDRPSAPDELAQDLCYDAFAAWGRRRRMLAIEALELCRDCADAYVLLAEDATTPEQRLELFGQGVEAGERALGAAFWDEHRGEAWDQVEARPLMRARLGLGQTLESLGRVDEAVREYRAMLELDEGDRLGVRGMLVPLLLRGGGAGGEEALDVLDRYARQDEGLALPGYARALALFELGRRDEADEALRGAIELNGAVVELLVDGELPEVVPNGYVVGGEDEAVCCAAALLEPWRGTPRALAWLGEFAGRGGGRGVVGGREGRGSGRGGERGGGRGGRGSVKRRKRKSR